SPRLVCHSELCSLAVAHVDCDAFYASVEKRDRPELADRPVIIGGGARGVVLACCYVARLYGVRSAMPMFKALAACPDAVVIRPDMAKYRKIGREVHAEMERLTPLVEPLSIDEAFLDLGGTEALHGACPAQLLIGLLAEIGERELASRYGRMGTRLAHLARGEDARAVLAHAPAHTISAETTLAQDECDAGVLVHALWPLCERLSARLKQASLAAG